MSEEVVGMGSRQRDSRDEDLALFHDMRKRERRHFLYPLKDDVEASPRRDEGLSTFCMSTSTPTRSGDNLLPLDSEKNDYDWLLTPPSTPLFPSLDQDVRVVNLSQRRILTRSDSISKTARLSYPQEHSSRIIQGGNPSPRPPSTASSTSSTISSSRGRPSSPSFTSRSSPAPRSSSPCRPTTLTGRNAANSAAARKSTSRSLTPTLRRNHSSLSSAANRLGPTNGRSRGKSLSPNVGPWEPSFPGFLIDLPPNLRTTLSDRSIQRGVFQTSTNGCRNIASFSEASEGSSRSLHCMKASDGDGNWSSSHGNDVYSSQNSKASVISCDDDADMADSALSGSTRTSFDSGPRPIRAVVPKLEDPSTRRSVLPVKRQMKVAGTGDPMPFISLTARKSHERQVAQRRNTQTMFRPLLSSAPITSIYSIRHGGMHLRPSSELCAIQNGSSHLSKNEGSGEQSKTGVLVGRAKPDNTTAGKEITEREAGGNSRLEGDMGCQSGLGPSDQKNLTGLGALEEKNGGGNSEGLHGEKGHSDHNGVRVIKPSAEDMACDTDVDIKGLKILDDGCIEAECSLKGHKHSKEAERSSEMSKVKDKLLTAVSPLSYLGTIGNVGSQHGAQRVLSDLGSFRRRSPMKNLVRLSHDGSMLSEKSVSCDSLMSDSQSFIRSLASAFSIDEPMKTQHEWQGDAVEEDVTYESKAGGSNAVCFERQPSRLDSHGEVHLNGNCAEPLEDISNWNADSELHSRLTHLNYPSPAHEVGWLDGQLRLHGLMDASPSEAITDTTGKSSISDVHDSISQHDILSILSSSAPSISLVDCGAGSYNLTESPKSIESTRFSDVLQTTTFRLATDASEREHTSQGQDAEVPSLKRSVTLEEATDTILFCSSIIHELVYKSVNLAIENEEQKATKPSVSRKDFVTLFGFSGADHRANGTRTARPRNRTRQPPIGDAAVCETSSYVQKQRMVHRQTPAVTMRQSPMDRIENAVMGNHEEMPAPVKPKLQKRRVKQGKRVQCRCNCCMM